MKQQSSLDVLSKTWKSSIITFLIYPLDRIATVQQIQSTYTNQKFKSHTSIIGQAIHQGFLSTYRGLFSFISRTSLLGLIRQSQDNLIPEKDSSQRKNYIGQFIKFSIITLGYSILYPFQITQIKMSCELERSRLYPNIRDCISKVKKNQGIKKFYHGFTIGYSIYLLQYSIVRFTTQYLQKSQNFLGIGAFWTICLGSEILIYPLTTLKKLCQINGSIGHTDINLNVRQALKNNTILQLYKGFPIRVANFALFSSIYLLVSNQ